MMINEEILELVRQGKLAIHVSSFDEKRNLMDICCRYGYSTDGCDPHTYSEYSWLIPYGNGTYLTFCMDSKVSDRMKKGLRTCEFSSIGIEPETDYFALACNLL